jgi:F1F0 ATPase subunit 2
MTNAIILGGAFAAGMVLGSLFFGGLWWTTHKGIVAQNPALWFLGSLLVRTGAMAAGFYFIAGGDWRRALACLFGFIAARLAVLRLARPLLQQPMIAMAGRADKLDRGMHREP